MKKLNFLNNYTFFVLLLVVVSTSFLVFSKVAKIKKVTAKTDEAVIETNHKSSPKFKYAIFDISKSFWEKSLYDIMYSFQKRKGISWSYYFKLVRFGTSYLMGNLNVKKAFESFLDFCKGETLHEVKQNCSAIWKEECKDFILQDAKNNLDKHKKESAITIISEPGNKELYADLRLTYSFDYICASKLEIKKGKVTGKLDGEPCSGEEKLKKVRNLIEEKLGGSLKDAIFYANSHNDIPLLEKVGKAVAINPDSKLERHAKKKGWEILKFKNVIKG